MSKDDLDYGTRLNHRKRVKQNIKFGGANAFSDVCLIEALLFKSYSRIDTQPIARRLVGQFKNIENIFNASLEELSSVQGVGEKTAIFIKQTCEFINKYIYELESPKVNVPTFNTARKLIREKIPNGNDCYNVLCLDSALNFNSLIEVEIDAKKTLKEYSVEIIKKAILSHGIRFMVFKYRKENEPYPTPFDDSLVKKLMDNFKCHSMFLADYSIIYGNHEYSYLTDGRLLEIQRAEEKQQELNIKY